MGSDAESLGDWHPTFRHIVVVSSSRVEKSTKVIPRAIHALVLLLYGKSIRQEGRKTFSKWL